MGVVAVVMRVRVGGVGGGVAGVGDLEAEQRRRVEAREGEEGPRGRVEAGAPAPAGE